MHGINEKEQSELFIYLFVPGLIAYTYLIGDGLLLQDIHFFVYISFWTIEHCKQKALQNRWKIYSGNVWMEPRTPLAAFIDNDIVSIYKYSFLSDLQKKKIYFIYPCST